MSVNIFLWKDHEDYILLAFPRETLRRAGKCKVIKMSSAYKDEFQTFSSFYHHEVFILFSSTFTCSILKKQS